MRGRNVNLDQSLPAELYSPATVDALRAACGRGFHGARNRALLALLYHAGLRCREALDLQLHDISGRRIHIRSGKGGKQRVAILRPEGAGALDAFLRVRGNQPGPLLASFDGSPLGVAAVRMLLPRLGLRAGLEQRIHAHGFRHTHACELLEAGVPTAVIQRQLGHSRLDSTERYLHHALTEDAIDAWVSHAREAA